VTWWTFLVALERPHSGSGSFPDDPAHFVLAKPQKIPGLGNCGSTSCQQLQQIVAVLECGMIPPGPLRLSLLQEQSPS